MAASVAAQVRYLVRLQWIGTNYHGWQTQGNVAVRQSFPTVQDRFEDAVARVANGTHVRVSSCGRTDAGVHAIAMPCHLNLERRSRRTNAPLEPLPAESLVKALNANLRGSDIQVLSAKIVSNHFHSRSRALTRSYIYRIVHGSDLLSTFENGLVHHVHHKLDVEAMRKAAKYFVGDHDFSSFRSAGCTALTPKKTMYRFDVNTLEGMPGGLRSFHETAIHASLGTSINIECCSNGFLYHQVRNMVGYLISVGKGAIDPEETPALLLRPRKRATMPPMVSAQGLYFYFADFGGADDRIDL